MKWKFEEEFRLDKPETIGETDRHFDLDNYKDWLEFQLAEARKQLSLFAVSGRSEQLVCDFCGSSKLDDYTELESVASRDSIRNNTSLKEEVEKQYCMPDEVNTKEEHEQYLKDIGYDKYIQELKDFKEKYEGKFILPKAPFEILEMFINHVGEKDFDMMVSDGETLSAEFDSWLRSVCAIAV